MKDLSKPQKDKDIATVEYVLANGSGTDLLPTDLMTKPTKIFTEVLFDNATGIINTKYLNENGSIIPQEIDLPSVFTRKGEILPQDIKGNVDSRGVVTSIAPTADHAGDISYNYISKEGTYKDGWIFLSKTYAKKTDLKSLQTTVSGVEQEITQIKQDIGGYAVRLQTQNKKLETIL